MRISTSRLVIALATLAAAPAAFAAESYDNCTGVVSSLPATIATQGTWCLTADLGTAMTSGHAITIAAPNVTIDCNHFKIGGLAAGPASLAVGIYTDKHNATVRNCSIRGFHIGVNLKGDRGLVEDSRLDNNLYYGVLTSGEDHIVRDNVLIDTGGAPDMKWAYAIRAVGSGARVLENSIHGVSSTGHAGESSPTGISIENGLALGNRISGLLPAPTEFGTVVGIELLGTSTASDNRLLPVGIVPAAGAGIKGASTKNSTCMHNVVHHYDPGIVDCTQLDNLVVLP